MDSAWWSPLAGLQGNELVVEAAATIQAAIAEDGLDLVVVGGTAVAAWDAQAEVTRDVDFVCAALTAHIDAALALLDFHREGRHWYHDELAVPIEVPATTLEPHGATAVEIDTRGGRRLIVISLVDLILDRVEQW